MGVRQIRCPWAHADHSSLDHKMSRLRILHTIPSLARVHGGPTRALLMMEAVLSGIAEITILTTDDDGPGRRLAKSIQVAPGDRAKRVYVRKWFEFYKIAPGLVPWLLRHVNCFDVVHIHALFSFSSVASALIARLRGVPYVVRPLGTLANYGISQRRPLLKRLSLAFIEGPILRHAAALHFTSESERDEARALGVPIRCVVIPQVSMRVSGRSTRNKRLGASSGYCSSRGSTPRKTSRVYFRRSPC